MPNAKRILFVDNVVSPHGKNIRPREHTEAETILKNRRYHPYFVVSEPVILKDPCRFFETKSFNDSRVETYRAPCVIISSLSLNRSLGKFGKLMFILSNLLFQSLYFLHLTLLTLSLTVVKRIDILHAHNPPDLTGLVSLLVSRITGVPYVFEVHDRAPELYCGEMGMPTSSLVYAFMKSIERLVVVNSAGIITVNKRVAEYYSLFRGPAPVAIYTGTHLNVEGIEEILSNNHRLTGGRVILYQGSLNMTSIGKPATYDLMLPLRAMPSILKDFPDAVLVYVGEGSGRQQLEESTRAMRLEKNVIFTGFIPQKRVYGWIGRADVVLIPYADNPNCHTTVPSKLYEYMAVGKPIVATDFPGISEIVENKRNGLLYNVNSIDDFTECVLRLLKDSELAQKIASSARKDFFSKYSLEKNWPKLISLYDSIIG